MSKAIVSLGCMLVAGALVSAPVFAGSFECRGVPSRNAVAREGALRFTVGFGVWTVCNINADGCTGGVNVTATAKGGVMDHNYGYIEHCQGTRDGDAWQTRVYMEHV